MGQPIGVYFPMYRRILLPLAITLLGSIVSTMVMQPWQRMADSLFKRTWAVEDVDSEANRFTVSLRALVRAKAPGLTVELPLDPASPPQVTLEMGATTDLADRCAHLAGRVVHLLSGWNMPADPTLACPITQWRANEVLRFGVALDLASPHQPAFVSIVAEEAFRPSRLPLAGSTERVEPWAYRLAVWGVPLAALVMIAAGATRLAATGTREIERADLLEECFITVDSDGSRRLLQHVLRRVVDGRDWAIKYFDRELHRNETVRAAVKNLHADETLRKHSSRINFQQLDDTWNRSFRVDVASKYSEGDLADAYASFEQLKGAIQREFEQFASDGLEARDGDGEPELDESTE